MVERLRGLLAFAIFFLLKSSIILQQHIIFIHAMKNINTTAQAIEYEVVGIISSVTKIHPNQLIQVRDLTELGLDIVDVVDVILKVEKAFHLTIPDEVPVYSVDDFVNYIYTQSIKQAC